MKQGVGCTERLIGRVSRLSEPGGKAVHYYLPLFRGQDSEDYV